jgi:hypothetical protein
MTCTASVRILVRHSKLVDDVEEIAMERGWGGGVVPSSVVQSWCCLRVAAPEMLYAA